MLTVIADNEGWMKFHHELTAYCLLPSAYFPSQFMPREQTIRFEIARGRGGGDCGRERRRGRPFVPVERFQVVAHVLFVERALRMPRLIRARGPEARRVGRQSFVNQNDLAITVAAELKLGVGDDDTARARAGFGFTIERERGVA